MLVVGCLFTIPSQALENRYDVSKEQPIIVVEGETISYSTLFNNLYFGNTKLYSAYMRPYSQQVIINNSVVKNIPANSTITGSLNTTQYSSILATQSSVAGRLVLQFRNPQTSKVQTTEVPFYIIKNTPATIDAPHIYVSAEDFKNGKLTEAFVKSKISVEDAEGRNLQPSIANFTSIINTIPKNNGYPTKTTTVCLTVSVYDYNKTTTVPCYVTVLADTDIEHSYSSDTYTRSISEKYYPYHLSNVKKNANGTYGAREEDGIIYFLDNTNNFLKIDGEKVPVDACLTTSVKKVGSDYEVTPLSKWVTNGNCASLLVGCLTNDDPNDFISSWTFDRHDIKSIQKMCADGMLDENFYNNYLANGYCEAGTRMPNQTSRKTASQPCGDGVVWYVADNTLYIDTIDGDYTYKMNDYNGNYNIPLFNKTSSGNNKTTAPWANYTFNKVVIDDRVTHIGNYAFIGCENITEPVEIPDSCSTIGTGAFACCTNMTGDIQTKKVFSIGDMAFANCGELRGRLHLGDDALYKIGNYAFYGCGFTSSLTIPTSTVEIGDYAFMDCRNMSGNLIINDNVKSIGQYAFYNCISLDGDLKLPYALTELKQFTFGNCIGFNGKIWLNDNLTKINDYAFYNCTNIMGDVILPDNLTEIGVGAFKNCRNLKTNLIINPALRKIKNDAFYGCANITVIDNSKTNKSLVIEPRAFYVTESVTTKLTESKDPVFNGYNFFGDNRMVTIY